jgi:hypothetical protein
MFIGFETISAPVFSDLFPQVTLQLNATFFFFFFPSLVSKLAASAQVLVALLGSPALHSAHLHRLSIRSSP